MQAVLIEIGYADNILTLLGSEKFGGAIYRKRGKRL